MWLAVVSVNVCSPRLDALNAARRCTAAQKGINRDDAYDGIRRIAAFPAGSELVRDDARLIERIVQLENERDMRLNGVKG